MTVSIFHGCSDGCGWIAAIVSSIAFGSFGVPIKGASAPSKIEVDPLVMQSYKTLVCFFTCWLVLFMGEEVRFTPWGVVSGLFWVPGAACGIYAIRNAGLAIAVGTWSSIIVIFSFLWGIVIFREPIKDFGATGCAFLLLIVGLVGMSQYARPSSAPSSSLSSSSRNLRKTISTEEGQVNDDGDDVPMEGLVKRGKDDSRAALPSPPPTSISGGVYPLEIEPLIILDDSDLDNSRHNNDKATKDRMIFLGGRVALTRRQLGIICAIINGAWGGTNLIPMHFARNQGFAGAGYIISYACGSLLVNIWVWIVLFAYYCLSTGGVRDAYDALPCWHLKQLWRPGLLAGSLYSLGNFSSILAVTYLGQGVGYSFCQCQILISGLWGIFYYKEIQGRQRITKWFLSALVTVLGILWLSYEHQSSMAHR